jgi:hypothetical protein
VGWKQSSLEKKLVLEALDLKKKDEALKEEEEEEEEED